MTAQRMRLGRWILWLFVAMLSLAFNGCATDDADSTSARPWNAPRDWETGLPAGMYDRR